jgi:hypothetical protein
LAAHPFGHSFGRTPAVDDQPGRAGGQDPRSLGLNDGVDPVVTKASLNETGHGPSEDGIMEQPTRGLLSVAGVRLVVPTMGGGVLVPGHDWTSRFHVKR